MTMDKGSYFLGHRNKERHSISDKEDLNSPFLDWLPMWCYHGTLFHPFRDGICFI